jgi:hypothetical protein
MNDYLDKNTDEELDAVADTVIDIIAFMYKYMKDQKGRPVRVKWHQILWLVLLELFPWVLILAPRGHGKSTIFTGWMLYKVCHDPFYRFLIASHIEELADEFSQRVQTYLTPFDPEPPLDVPYIPRDFPEVRKGRPWRAGKAYFDGKSYPYVKTCAAKAGMTGGRFDGAVFDDPQTKMGVQNEKMRRMFNMWANNAVLPALDETGKEKMVGIGTRKHIEDWYSTVLANDYFVCHVDQLYSYNELGEKVYLWPSVEEGDLGFYGEREDKLRATMQPDEFAMEYMNIPIAAEGLRFKLEWVEPNFFTGKVPVDDRHIRYYMGVDPSLGSKKDRASYAAIAVIAFDQRPTKQDIYVVDLVRSKLSLAEQEDIIKSIYDKYTVTLPNGTRIEPVCVMEDVLVNKIFADRMRAQLPSIITVDYIHSGLKGTSDVSKIGRIENVFGWLAKNGKIHLQDPKTDAASKLFMDSEYLQFPEGDMDELDALTLACDRVDLRVQIKDFNVLMW